MKTAFKIISVFANLLSLAAGAWVTITMLLDLDFYSIFYIEGMSSAESLYFNLIMFIIGIALLMFILPMFSDEKPKEVEFPTIYGIIPLIIGLISVYFAFNSSTSTIREKIIIIASAVLYVLLSEVIIYNSAKIFSK